MEYVIETQNLVKQYKTKLAVNDVSIHVKRGDIYGLIGKNGAGKTSLMKLILGLTTPTRGKIQLFVSGWESQLLCWRVPRFWFWTNPSTDSIRRGLKKSEILLSE